MTDENKDLKKKFGRKINIEKEGYTDVGEDGIARPRLKINDPERDVGLKPIPKGRRRMTAVYTDERREEYKSSLTRTWLIYGSKCYVHCPTIYHPANLEEITFTANLFANNRPVPHGNSKFKYNGKTVSKAKLPVSNGYVEETFQLIVHNGSEYSCHYEGDEIYWISEGMGVGDIYKYIDYKTPLVVDVNRLIMNVGETSKLVARVYLRDHGDSVNYPADIPESGTITFYIDREQYGQPVPIKQNGFASIPYTATHGVGVHLITAIYKPDTEKMKELYQETTGANTLFIGDDTNKPKLTQTTKNCGKRNEEIELAFNSDRELNGLIRIYIDGTSLKDTTKSGSKTRTNGTITMYGNKGVLYEQLVQNKSSFSYHIKIPDREDMLPESIWGYGGYHNMIIQYVEFDEELGDMEYWYMWDDFVVQIETKISVDGDLDNTSDNGVYTGNNMYIDDETIVFRPNNNFNEVPQSITVGNPLRVLVEDAKDFNVIKGGTVKIIVDTRDSDKLNEHKGQYNINEGE